MENITKVHYRDRFEALWDAIRYSRCLYYLLVVSSKIRHDAELRIQCSKQKHNHFLAALYKPCPRVYYDAVSSPTPLTGPLRGAGTTECYFMINATEKNTDSVQLTMKSVEFDTEVRVYEAEDTETPTVLNAARMYDHKTYRKYPPFVDFNWL